MPLVVYKGKPLPLLAAETGMGVLVVTNKGATLPVDFDKLDPFEIDLVEKDGALEPREDVDGRVKKSIRKLVATFRATLVDKLHKSGLKAQRIDADIVVLLRFRDEESLQWLCAALGREIGESYTSQNKFRIRSITFVGRRPPPGSIRTPQSTFATISSVHKFNYRFIELPE